VEDSRKPYTGAQKASTEDGSTPSPKSQNLAQQRIRCREFDFSELDELEAALDSIASGAVEAGLVRNTARQIVAERI
jgi:hypothetical protein